MKDYGIESNAYPFQHSDSSYGGAESTYTWDENKIYGCVCDSSWTVGYASGETQASEWFGPDCSLKRCPSGDDPRTTNCINAFYEYANEANCFLKDNNGRTWRGPVDVESSPDYLTYITTNTLKTAATAVGAIFVTAGGDHINTGDDGNLCHVDCANRGLCDFSTGTCQCFDGYYGEACTYADVLAKSTLA